MTDNSTNNGSNDYDASAFFTIEIVTVYYLCILAVATTLSNGVVLLTIYKDPLRCLRNPSACFIAGLSSANLLTGLLAEPLLALLYARQFSDEGMVVSKVSQAALVLTFLAINASLLIILSLAVSQYIGVVHPALYHRFVSQKSAKIGVACVFLYALLFALLPHMGMDIWLFFEVDMYLHTTLITVALVLVYLLMYCKFREQWGASHGAEVRGSEENEQQRQEMEKEFIKGTFILTVFLIVTVWPYAITLFLVHYYDYSKFSDAIQLYMAFRICQNIFFLKFALDPLIFAWRLKNYRRSFVAVFGAMCKCGERNALPTISYHADDDQDPDVETVVI